MLKWYKFKSNMTKINKFRADSREHLIIATPLSFQTEIRPDNQIDHKIGRALQKSAFLSLINSIAQHKMVRSVAKSS